VDKQDQASNHLFGLGIAGNSAGHLQQTGESNAFAKLDDPNKPQALFPFYVPHAQQDYLALMPYSADQLQLPKDPQAKVQMEPELALKCHLSYNALGQLINLQPIAMTLINDATHRNAQVTKLAQKKNWGSASKGLANQEIKITDFTEAAQLERFRLCGFHQHNGQWHLCGEDVAVTEYSYFYQQLQQWIITQIQQQQAQALFHNIQDLLLEAGCPETILVAIGATRYSAYGEQHQLVSGDQTAIVLYDNNVFDINQIGSLLAQEKAPASLCNDNIMVLQQQVINALD
tara:strand:+ start:2594 stop:3457 length:864 start_codon:yes stop_codon:yes gene_type:complete